MNKFFGTLLLLVTLSRVSNGQKVEQPVNHDVFNRVLNNAFNKLVSSNPNAGEIANYASIDPINASFTAKGSIPIQPGRKKMLKSKTLSFEDKLKYDPAKISYLSFSAGGNLIDKSYGALFSNSSLNAGVTLGAQYNFRVGKAKFSYWLEDYTNFSVKEKILFQKYGANKIALENTLTDKELQRAKRLLELSKVSIITKLQKNGTETALVQKSVDSLGNNINQRPGLVDTLQKLLQDGLVLQKSYDGTQASLDSISAVGIHTSDFLVLQRNKLRDKLKKDYDALVTELPIQKVRLTWFTLIGGYSRKSYNTFDVSLPFPSQFDKGKLNAVNWGAGVNRLLVDSLKKRTLFFNLTIMRSRNNNLALLSTSTIDQTRKIGTKSLNQKLFWILNTMIMAFFIL